MYVANSKAYNGKKRLREEAEDAEDTSFEYRSIYFYLPEDHPTGIPNAEERLQLMEGNLCYVQGGLCCLEEYIIMLLSSCLASNF